MQMSKAGIDRLKDFEDFRAEPYLDQGGVLTIGFGHTSAAGEPMVRRGMKITPVQAEHILASDLAPFERAVNETIKVPLNQDQFDALVSLAYNIGGGAFRSSTLAKVINAGDYDLAPREFAQWVLVNGKPSNGLIRRRAAEGRLFMSDKIAYRHYKDVPADEWRWKDFSPAEMACKGTGQIMVDIASMDALQQLRDLLGKPMLITSAYRSPEHNKRVGGAKGSYHMKGKAFDVQMTNHDPVHFEELARKVGFSGFGYYPNSGFMHIDTGPMRSWGTKFPPRKDRFAEENKPVEKVKPKARAEGAAKAGGAVAGGYLGIEVVKQASEYAGYSKSFADAVKSFGPYVFAAVAIGIVIYIGVQWWKSRKEEDV